MELKKNLGKHIKEIRKQRGLSQEKLAELVNIEQNILSYIETGNNFCKSETLKKIINALNIDPKELFYFGHLKSEQELLNEINRILHNNPKKIPEFYKILKAIVN